MFMGKKTENFGRKRIRVAFQECAPLVVRTLIDSSRVIFHLGYSTISSAAIVATFRAGGLLGERSPLGSLFTYPHLLMPPESLFLSYGSMS